MEKNKVDLFITVNAKYFNAKDIPQIRQVLTNMPEEKFDIIQVQSGDLKDPVQIFMASLVAGTLGVDRFLIGDVGLGILKLITFGGCGIWIIIDWFFITNATKDRNLEMLLTVV